MLLSAKAGDATHNHPLDKTCLKRRNRQIQDNLHLVRPIARHYAQQTGLESDDLLQVGCLGLIKAYNRYDAQRGAPFPSFAKPHIRGAILHFLRDRVGLIRLPRAVEERAMQMARSSEGSALSPADALMVDHYRSKQHWVEFNDELLDDTAQAMDLVERSETWSRVNKLFRNLGKDDQCALQMVVIDGMSLRQTAQLVGVSAMTVQRRVKRGLNTIAKKLNAAQPEA
ncbi:sigma-70 family RNA polymerase sigma factor [Synechococcus sp. A15-44]|uniref:sigma-70 family RNA polymerase sigma factor n=1 Tax=Synechococcus sp. A15-44 TaxID=1050646 RepID=UPI0016473F5C|nr:sigma-70 family RNA polymerase sigma factor [Synechococcus sp. A15-44]QNI64451.1 RNA polymerase sigma factor/ type III [Synechococcus sp. A15-44]